MWHLKSPKLSGLAWEFQSRCGLCIQWLFSLRKEENCDRCYSTEESWGHGAGCNAPVTRKTNTVWFFLQEVLRTVQFIETKSGRVVVRGEGTEDQGASANGYEVQLGNTEKSHRWMVVPGAQQRECTYCHWIVHLTMVKKVTFILRIFYNNKKMF